jgi:glycosyltransferase involved in cell wall biosynthesis
MLSVIILTYNSSASIQRTLDALKQISDDIHAVDSFSTDETASILKKNGCHVVQRRFTNYSDQRNWAIDNLPLKYDWQFHVDADEELEQPLIKTINALELAKSSADGFIIGRKIVFLGKTLKFGSIAKTWHYRIFRKGFGRCESRLYDQHFVGSGKTETLDVFMLDHQEDTIAEWTSRHNLWSDLESKEISAEMAPATGQITPDFLGNKIERTRARKRLYYRAPLFLRALMYFLFRYVVLLGFLDGKEGLIYHVLQGFWFRFLVDAKIYEASRRRSAAADIRAPGAGP